ncbi:hypothetical protein DPMN_009838 [Dreissena polymorpha]|uniref:Uncharacterized protein n=1 Tax=Dreissena polymorpha TaxID=45954 RepID=A0A9D4RYK3_DREPO|nr:hypothetical protein DPMN_009838 [Dreissena polymorpha]
MTVEMLAKDAGYCLLIVTVMVDQSTGQGRGHRVEVGQGQPADQEVGQQVEVGQGLGAGRVQDRLDQGQRHGQGQGQNLAASQGLPLGQDQVVQLAQPGQEVQVQGRQVSIDQGHKVLHRQPLLGPLLESKICLCLCLSWL